jgi:hypothetical protein
MNKHTIKIISPGHYEYRGFEIRCLGYYPPERSIVWAEGTGALERLRNIKDY